MQAHHIFIAVSLSQNRCRRDISILTIALNYAFIGDIARWVETIAVNSQKLRLYLKTADRYIHTLEGCLEDVDLINTLRRNLRHSPRHSLALDDGAQLIALTLGHLLRVVEQRVKKVGRQNNRRRKDTARQASASRLITACLKK